MTGDCHARIRGSRGLRCPRRPDFTLEIADGSFGYRRNQPQIEQEASFDGIYVIRTGEPPSRIGSHAVVRAYKQLKVNEHAFREIKTPLEIRPIHHHLDDRVRAHVFLCMLACYVQFELARVRRRDG
ncbi:MAG: hypothetical protein ACLP01_07855 [Solirubrobacteraceae bacterium]